MENLKINGSANEPSVNFDAQTGELDILGISTPEDAYAFYKILRDWLNGYTKEPAENTVMTIELDYFNTSTSKAILGVLRFMETLHHAGYDAMIVWKYAADDEDMLETGKEYSKMLDVSFELVELR